MSTKTHTEVVLRNLSGHLSRLADHISATCVDGRIPSHELPEFRNPDWVDGFIEGMRTAARFVESDYLPPPKPKPKPKLRLVVSR